MLLSYDFYGSNACSACAGSYLINSGFRCLHLLTGGSPAATHFSLLRQRKLSKRKATRLSGALRFASGNLRCPRAKQNGTGGERNPNSQTATTPRRGPAQIMNAIYSIAAYKCPACVISTFNAKTPGSDPESAPASPVLAGPVLGGQSGIRARACLSRRRVCTRPPLCLTSTGCLKRSARPQTAGRLFFGDFLLAKQKKVTSRRATPGQQAITKPTQRRNRKKAGTKP